MEFIFAILKEKKLPVEIICSILYKYRALSHPIVSIFKKEKCIKLKHTYVRICNSNWYYAQNGFVGMCGIHSETQPIRYFFNMFSGKKDQHQQPSTELLTFVKFHLG